jgi:hypothetical protein
VWERLSTGEQTSNKECPELAHGVRRSADDRIRQSNGVNEEPSTYNREPNDANPLTPNHILHQPHQFVPPDDQSTFEENGRRRWRYAQFKSILEKMDEGVCPNSN